MQSCSVLACTRCYALCECTLLLPPARPPCSGKAGVTVGGKLEGGALCPGSKVLLMPAGQPATVK